MSPQPFEPPAEATSRRTSLDRRAFLGGVGVAAGAALAASVLPIAAAHGAPLAVLPGARTRGADEGRGVGAAEAGLRPEDAWHIDDMWGHWPRYAHPIPHAGAGAAAAEHAAALWERIDPVDRMLLI